MITLFIILLFYCMAIYLAGMALFLIGLSRKPPLQITYKGFVSVVIAARNEEAHIGDLLDDLCNQTFPPDRFEIIVANDHSTDSTGDIVDNFCKRLPNCTCLDVTTTLPNLTAKKNALSQGIAAARGEIILTVDADCRIKTTWIESMTSYFTKETGMVAGFSQLGFPGERLTLFERLQALDFLALMSAALGTIKMGLAWSASGQNLAYRREAYEAIGGFRDIGHRLSGDDVLLMQLIRRRTRWKIRFAEAPESFNTSRPEPALSSLLRQRSRWASNGAYQLILNLPFFLYCVAVLSLNVLIVGSIPLLFFGLSAVYPAAVLLIKALAEGLVIWKGSKIFRRRDLRRLFPLWFIWQIPYIIIVGLLGNFGRITWKSRTAKTVWKPR